MYFLQRLGRFYFTYFFFSNDHEQIKVYDVIVNASKKLKTTRSLFMTNTSKHYRYGNKFTYICMCGLYNNHNKNTAVLKNES